VLKLKKNPGAKGLSNLGVTARGGLCFAPANTHLLSKITNFIRVKIY
jgi:hypothetical protein